jgi:hypothetical protein
MKLAVIGVYMCGVVFGEDIGLQVYREERAEKREHFISDLKNASDGLAFPSSELKDMALISPVCSLEEIQMCLEAYAPTYCLGELTCQAPSQEILNSNEQATQSLLYSNDIISSRDPYDPSL